MKHGWKGVIRLRVKAETMTLYAVTDRTWAKEVTLMEQVKQALKGGITFCSFVKRSFQRKNL